MSVTVDAIVGDTTNDVQLAYKPAVYTVSTTDPNIVRMIADVYENSTVSTQGNLYTSIEKSPDIGTTDTFTFDFQTAIQENLGVETLETTSTIILNKNFLSCKGFKINFYKVVDNGTTFDTSWLEDGAGTEDLTTDFRVFINGTLPHDESFDKTDYQKNGTYLQLSRGFKPEITFASASVNKAKKVQQGDRIPINCPNDKIGTDYRMRVNQYDSDDTFISAITSNARQSDRFQMIGWFNTDHAASNAKKLSLTIDEDPYSTNFIGFNLYEIVPACNDYVSFYWQNSLGGIDYYLFRNSQQKSYESETTTYTQPLSSSYVASDFGETVIGKTSRKGVRVTSDTLSRNDAEWLREIITHANRGWIYDGTNYLPVIVADGSMTTLDTENGLYRLDVDLIHSNKIHAQRY